MGIILVAVEEGSTQISGDGLLPLFADHPLVLFHQLGARGK